MYKLVVAWKGLEVGRRGGSPTSPRPAPEGLDPLRALRRWSRKRQLEERDHLSSLSSVQMATGRTRRCPRPTSRRQVGKTESRRGVAPPELQQGDLPWLVTRPLRQPCGRAGARERLAAPDSGQGQPAAEGFVGGSQLVVVAPTELVGDRGTRDADDLVDHDLRRPVQPGAFAGR